MRCRVAPAHRNHSAKKEPPEVSLRRWGVSDALPGVAQHGGMCYLQGHPWSTFHCRCFPAEQTGMVQGCVQVLWTEPELGSRRGHQAGLRCGSRAMQVR